MLFILLNSTTFFDNIFLHTVQEISAEQCEFGSSAPIMDMHITNPFINFTKKPTQCRCVIVPLPSIFPFQDGTMEKWNHDKNCAAKLLYQHLKWSVEKTSLVTKTK